MDMFETKQCFRSELKGLPIYVETIKVNRFILSQEEVTEGYYLVSNANADSLVVVGQSGMHREIKAGDVGKRYKVRVVEENPHE